MEKNNDPDFRAKVFRLVEDAIDRNQPDGHVHVNIEVGRDMVGGDQIIIHAGPVIDPNHPNATLCPQCGRPTWRYSKDCRQCGYDLFAHAERERVKRIKERNAKIMAASIAVMAGAIYLSGYLPSELSGWASGIGVLAMLVAAATAKQT